MGRISTVKYITGKSINLIFAGLVRKCTSLGLCTNILFQHTIVISGLALVDSNLNYRFCNQSCDSMLVTTVCIS